MAKLPSAPINLIPATSAPSVPPDLTMEQWLAIKQAAAVKLPKCTVALPCGTPNVNDERAYTRAAPVNCTTCDWWLPVGTITTQIQRFRAYWHVSQLGNLKTPITQIIPESTVPFGGRTDVAEWWRKGSKAAFNREVDSRTPNQAQLWNQSSPAPFGRTRDGRVISALDVSLNRFMTAMPDFVQTYLDQAVPDGLRPTTSELTEDGGVERFKRRGGYLLYKPVLEGRVPLKNVSLWACAEWCAGCPNPILWPGGTPTCVKSIQIETENFDWGIFVARKPGEYVVSISRLPKSTWDKIEDGIRTVTDQLDRFEGWMCKTYNSPIGQVAAGQGSLSPDPQTQLATRSFNYLLTSGCKPGPESGTQQTTYDPNAPRPSPKAGTLHHQGALMPSGGDRLAPLPRSSLSKTQVIVGLAALGLIAAGGVAVMRKRRR